MARHVDQTLRDAGSRATCVKTAPLQLTLLVQSLQSSFDLPARCCGISDGCLGPASESSASPEALQLCVTCAGKSSHDAGSQVLRHVPVAPQVPAGTCGCVLLRSNSL